MLDSEPAPPEATKFERPASAAEDGPSGAGDSNAQKEWLPDEPRMVYVGNLAWSVKWQELKDHMKKAGTVEFARILTFDGTDFGRSRGAAYVRYSTEAEAKEAVATLNNTELNGRTIAVDAWTGAKPRPGVPKGVGKGFLALKGGVGKGGFGGFGGYGFGFGGFPKGGKGYGFGFKGYGYSGKGFGKAVKVHGDFSQMVYVGNLPFKAEWQELKDHMKQAGPVEFVKILTEDGTEYGRSKGIGCVRYTAQADAEQAVSTLNGSLLMGRKIIVDKWLKSTPGGAPAGAPAGAASEAAAEAGESPEP